MKNSRLSKNLFCLVTVSVLLLTSCSQGGPGDEQDLADALSRDDVFTTEEAECIADKVFSEYGDDEDALKSISNVDDIAELESGEDAVTGFSEKFQTFQEDCTN